MNTPPAADLPPSLQRLVVKEGVALGGLSAGLVATEPKVNEALKAQLAGPGRFIDVDHVDHVELRRWPVGVQGGAAA